MAKRTIAGLSPTRKPARSIALAGRTRQRILALGRRALEKGGPEAVSMRQIAQRAGITPMALYYYFQGRDALLKELCRSEFDRLRKYFSARGRAPGLQRPLLAYLDYALGHPRMFLYLFSDVRNDARKFPDDFREGKSPTLNLLAGEIRRGMEEGRFKKDDLWEVALSAWAQAHGLIVLYLGGRFNVKEDEFKRLYTRSLRRLWHGLKS
jgi:AcrR family transcriptional regulator